MAIQRKLTYSETTTANGTPVDAPDQLGESADDLASLRDLLGRGDVAGARALLGVLEQRWPEAAWVKHYSQVLAPPVATMRPVEPRPSHDREHQWLQEHARHYPGCWLAVLGEQLIAADPSFSVVLRAVRQSPGADQALLFFQPGAAD
jgi:hypothetical protein